MRVKHLLAGLPVLIVVACASPQERAYKAAVSDYRRREVVVVDFARVNVKQLVAATKAFRFSVGRWPQTFTEFGDFVLNNHTPLDLTAFNDATFASLSDGSVQVYYDLNCSRFDYAQYKFMRTGSVNVKSR